MDSETVSPEDLIGVFPQPTDEAEAEDRELLSRIRVMREQKQRDAVLEQLQAVGSGTGHPGVAPVIAPDTATAVVKWAAKLPKDVGIAVWDITRNLAELSLDAGATLADAQFQQFSPLAEAMQPKRMSGGQATGQIEPGNIDLNRRPVVSNPDGTVSTVRSIGVNIDGREVLLPTIGDDGKDLTTEEAVARYRETGEHLGIFDTSDNASAYARTVSERQGRLSPSQVGGMYRQLKAEQSTAGAQALRDLQARQGEDLPPNLDDTTSLDLRDLAPEFIDAVDKARAWAGQGDNTADIITQKLFQFAGPFAAAMRVMGGLSKAPGMAAWLANTAKAGAADFLTSYAVFDPHEARFADLLKEIVPGDTRLVNAYVDYAMSDPADTDAEGRWKNAVDGAAVGLPFAVGSAVFQSGRALRRARAGTLVPMEPPAPPAAINAPMAPAAIDEHYAPGLEAWRSRTPLTSTTAPLAQRNDPSGSSSRQDR